MPKISGVNTNNFSKINGILKANISKVNGISGLFAASPTPTPTNTPTRTVTPTRTPTPSVTPSISVSPTRTPTVTPTVTPSITVSPTRTPTVTPSVTPSISVSPTRTPTVTPTVTPSITVSPTRTPTVTPTPSSTPAACNNISASFGTNKDMACYPDSIDVNGFDVNGTDLSNSTKIYAPLFGCASGKEASAGYYKDSTGLYYYNGASTITGDTCPPCEFVSVNYNSTSDRIACYANNNIVNVYIDSGTPTLNDPITHLWNSCVWDDLAPNGYYYSQGDNVLVYWDGSTVTKPSCPDCFDLLLPVFNSANDACTGGGLVINGPFADTNDLATASGLYNDCAFQNPATTGYYAQGAGPGTPVYYWDGTTLSFDSTCP